MMGTVGVTVFCFSVASLSLTFSVSLDCMQSRILWLCSAAILVTQLTTPYIRIAPAAGDNQLTGQIRGFPVRVLPTPCVQYDGHMIPPGGKHTSGILLVCGFVYGPANCIESVMYSKTLDNTFSLHLLIITAHERPVWLSFHVSVLESFGKS